MTRTSTYLAATTLALSLLPLSALAQNYQNRGYLVDGSGQIVTTAVPGQCWHTSDWTPALAVESCDPITRRVVQAAPAPAPAAAVPVAPMALVAPMPVAMVKSVPVKVSFSSDALFAFDKSDIKAEGKTMLNDLVQHIQGAQYEQIMLTGHADRIGKADYNQALSERRAATVKEYLVGQNIPAASISAKGVGETQPVTMAGDCAHLKMPKLVACLQPDRHVDVEMSGTKAPTQ